VGLRRELADRHVFDHALPQRAYGLVGHGGCSCLDEGCEPLISRQDAPLRYPVGCAACRRVLPCERFSPLVLNRRRRWMVKCPPSRQEQTSPFHNVAWANLLINGRSSPAGHSCATASSGSRRICSGCLSFSRADIKRAMLRLAQDQPQPLGQVWQAVGFMDDRKFISGVMTLHHVIRVARSEQNS
jgi:hypothetical protein